MPGKILDHNATSQDGNTLTWVVDLTAGTLDISAESNPNESSGGSSSILLYALIGAAVVIAAPMLLSALAIGLFIGMFQAATSINEQTLSFIPKLLVTFGVIMFAGPWILNLLVNYFQRLM